MADDFRTDHCRKCGAEIIWAVSEWDRTIAVDAKPSKDGNLRLLRRGERQAPRSIVVKPSLAFGATTLRLAHSATCPQGKGGQRRPKGSKRSRRAKLLYTRDMARRASAQDGA